MGYFLPLYAGFMHLPAFLQAAGDLHPGQGFMGGSNAKSPRRCGRGSQAKVGIPQALESVTARDVRQREEEAVLFNL